MLCLKLVVFAGKERQIALDEFYEQWKDDSLVTLKWLGIQTGSNIKGNLKNVQQLLEHPAVNINNPNTCYSTFLGFARSPVNFHAQDGSGYRFMADSTLKVLSTHAQAKLQASINVLGLMSNPQPPTRSSGSVQYLLSCTVVLMLVCT